MSFGGQSSDLPGMFGLAWTKMRAARAERRVKAHLMIKELEGDH